MGERQPLLRRLRRPRGECPAGGVLPGLPRPERRGERASVRGRVPVRYLAGDRRPPFFFKHSSWGTSCRANGPSPPACR
jgi:hypothetical protein